MKYISLDNILVNKNRVDYFFSVEEGLQKYFKKSNHLFLEYNYDISDVPKSILAIPFVSNIIPLIWITNATILIEELDKAFCECLNKVKIAYQNMFPNVNFKGLLKVNKVVDNTFIPENEAASFFSGGLDAITTFIRVKDKKPYLITEYGWHEDEIEYSEVWNEDKKNAITFANSYNLKNILIQSNYGTFLVAKNIDYDFRKKLNDSWWHGLHHGLAIISSAIPVAFKLKINCLYIASSNSPHYPVACASDPTVDNEIVFGSGSVFHDGYELTRQEKVKVVTEYFSETKEPIQIRVCFRKEENCCDCEKCLRTILGIIAEGQNPCDYGFKIPSNISQHVKNFLEREVKFLTPTFIMIYWKPIQQRIKENANIIGFKNLLEWFLTYDFVVERNRALFKYRFVNFFPILKRKINTRLNRLLGKVA